MSNNRSTFDKILTTIVLVITAIIIMIAIGVLFGYTINGPQGNWGDRANELESPEDEEYRGLFHALSSGSTGRGEFTSILSRDNSMLSFSANVHDLSGPITQVTINIAANGTNGPVVKDITSSFIGDGFQEESIANGIWMSPPSGGPQGFSETIAGALKRGEIYILVSTETFPAGETRAQLERSN